MFEIRRIEKEEEASEAFRLHNPDAVLPEFMFHESRYQGIVLSLMEDGKQAGLFFGIMVKGETSFYLHHFSVSNACCKQNKKDIQGIFSTFLGMFFSYLKEHYQVPEVIASISQEKREKPPIIPVLENMSSCEVKKVIYMRQICIKTKDFSYLRQFRWYRPEHLEKKHYKAVLWKDYSQEEIQKIKEAELLHQTEDDYLSPGLWEREWEYDEKTSFVLVKQGEESPLGWIVTEKAEDGKTVKIRRFYIYRELREKIIGPFFATWVLDAIAEQYEYLAYEVVQGNEQMERFTERYCEPLKVYEYFRYGVTVII